MLDGDKAWMNASLWNAPLMRILDLEACAAYLSWASGSETALCKWLHAEHQQEQQLLLLKGFCDKPCNAHM
jgi:hypothetical protein